MEVSVNPIEDGVELGQRYLQVEPTLEVPWSPDDALPYLRDTRYCGLANAVFRQQGEPSILPSP